MTTMTGEAARLLRQLEPAVRPGVAPASARAPRTGADAVGFDDVLALVSRGAITSGRAVRVAPDASLAAPLDDAQLDRVAAALDRVEAAGGRRALLLLDDRALLADVVTRTVTREADGDGAPIVGIDAAVWVRGADDDDHDVPRLPGGVLSPALARLFGGADPLT